MSKPKSLEMRQHEARLARARALRNIASVEVLKRQWAAEEHARSTAGVYEAEMRQAEREFGPMARKWSAELEVIERNHRFGYSDYSPEDFIRDQLLSASEGFYPGNGGDYWKR